MWLELTKCEECVLCCNLSSTNPTFYTLKQDALGRYISLPVSRWFQRFPSQTNTSGGPCSKQPTSSPPSFLIFLVLLASCFGLRSSTLPSQPRSSGSILLQKPLRFQAPCVTTQTHSETTYSFFLWCLLMKRGFCQKCNFFLIVGLSWLIRHQALH